MISGLIYVGINNLVLVQDFNPINGCQDIGRIPKNSQFKLRYVREYVTLSEFIIASLTWGCLTVIKYFL